MIVATLAEDVELVSQAGIDFIFASMNDFLPLYGLAIAFFVGIRFFQGR